MLFLILLLIAIIEKVESRQTEEDSTVCKALSLAYNTPETRIGFAVFGSVGRVYKS